MVCFHPYEHSQIKYIVDLFNGEVISYNISESPNFHQIEDMLDKAFIRISDNTNLILHSDQGWQYQMEKYQKRLAEKRNHTKYV